MATKIHPGNYDCYQKAEPDEPLFTLLARDPDAPGLIREWVKRRELRGNDDPRKLAEARACADQMESWRVRRWLKNQKPDSSNASSERSDVRLEDGG